MNQQRRVHTEQAPGTGQFSRYPNQQMMDQQQQDEEYDLNQLPDNAEDQYDIVGAENDTNDTGGGEQAAEQADGDDVENIDFNNYKGIYADDDAGQKYQCPETGAHFEPKDLCKRIYKIIEKRKPFEMDVYGGPMLVDGVGSSLIANAPYAENNMSSDTL